MGYSTKRTRYFTFTRVNPYSCDYSHLLDVCERIDGSLCYKTIRDGWKIRLMGFIVLRGPTTIVDDIRRLLPNFNVTLLDMEFESGYDWIVNTKPNGEEFFVDGAVFQNAKVHPFHGLKACLFPE